MLNNTLSIIYWAAFIWFIIGLLIGCVNVLLVMAVYNISDEEYETLEKDEQLKIDKLRISLSQFDENNLKSDIILNSILRWPTFILTIFSKKDQ